MTYNDKLEMVNFEYLKNLNEAQKEAVLYLDGPLLIVAGAGSGKTKVLTSRIAHIIKEKKAFPNQVLAVTFTNKAAKEMHNRVSSILKKEAVGLSWLGTFHSVCAKLLRKHAPAAGLNSNFTIIDTDDQIRLIKNICKSENIDIKQLAPKYILSIIDRWKNKGYFPNQVIINKKDIYEKTVLPLYKIYQQKFEKVLEILAPVLDIKQTEASFYLWPKTPICDELFAQKLFEQQHVTVLPGSYLSRTVDDTNPGENRVRMALVAPEADCIEAAKRIRTFVEGL